MIWLLAASLAAASEEPDPEPVRHTNSSFGLGLAHLGVTSAGTRAGLLLDFRGEIPLASRFQLNLLLSAGITQPQNTVAVFQWGLNHGAWTTNAFIDVTEWAGRGPEDLRAFRMMGAFLAYPFLALSYCAVPVAWMASPFAAVGHAVAGPTISWHSDALAPNGFVELGLGGSLYGHPATHLPQAAWGPMAGVGLQAGKQTLGLRVLVAPEGDQTVIATSFAVTL